MNVCCLLFICLFVYLPACCQHCVPHLIYTSTYNVVFGGQVIRNGDEQLPYLPLDKVGFHLV